MLPPASRALPPLGDLTLPGESSTTVRALLSAAVRQAIAVARAIGSRPTSEAAVIFRRSVLPALSRDPGLLASAMLQPSRLVLARVLAFDGDAPAAARARWEAELATLLAVDAGLAGKLGREVALFEGPTRLVVERLGLALDVPNAREWRIGDAEIEAVTTAGRARIGWGESVETAERALASIGGRALASRAPVRDGVDLVLVDNNPLSSLEAHPDKAGNAVDLGGREASAWTSALGAALAVIDDLLPEIAAEMRLVLRHLVPVGWDAEKHLSASYLEAIGVVYLTLHPHEMTLVEALVHEFQHNKLNLALGFDPLMENGESPLYASPVRPDPRPLRGVLLAVHAFQPIAILYERLLARGDRPDRAWLEKRLRQIARTCREGCDVLLPNAVPTAAGGPLFDELRSLDQHLAPWLDGGK